MHGSLNLLAVCFMIHYCSNKFGSVVCLRFVGLACGLACGLCSCDQLASVLKLQGWMLIPVVLCYATCHEITQGALLACMHHCCM